MKERITFVHRTDDDFDPKQLRVEHDALHVQSLKAAREDQLTFGISELPQELLRLLKQCHELHIRWTSLNPYAPIPPFVSRTSPGLHVSFTPQKDRTANLLCPLLQKVFGEQLKCTSPEETFTSHLLKSERFATSAALQYHQLLPSLKELVTYIQQKICTQLDESCINRASGLLSANYFDADYDTISQALILTSFHSASPNHCGWTLQLPKPSRSSSLEIGVLSPQPATEPESLSLGGFLTKLGSDSKPKPTLFSFPSRHHLPPHSTNATYAARFLSPTGLHPTLRLAFSSSLAPYHDSCKLHSHIPLPSPLFPDKYQLSLPSLLRSKNLASLRALSGETDLEAPDWVVQKWGSSMLLELAPPRLSSIKEGGTWSADIPLHLRYLTPAKGGIREVNVPWPVVFWACPAEEGTKMRTNPFDRVHLGYESVFGPRTMFVHLMPEPWVGETGREGGGEQLVERISVPVIDSEWVGGVEVGTVIVVLVGVLWVVGKLVGALGWDWRANGRGKGKGKSE